MPIRPRAALATLLAAAVLVAGCGDDDPAEGAGDTTGTTTQTTAGEPGTTTEGPANPTTPAPAGLPTFEALADAGFAGLEGVYGPPLAELGLRLTRGDIVPYRGGNHLQLYVEPTTGEDENPPEAFLDRMLPSFLAIRPLLFDAYPELDTFDLCQEPVPDPAAPTTEPGYEEPVTLLLVSRAGHDSVEDWSTATLGDLFAAASEDLDGVLQVSPEVAALPGYQEAIASS